jgi:arginase family enzyme
VAREQLADGGFLLWLAGNHLGVLPVYEELGPRTLVVQLDAHLDCYNLYDCTDTLSHGNWLLHAETPLPRVANVGHRDLFLHPGAVAERFALAVPADAFALDPAKAVARLRRLASKADRVWLDIDVDVFDPTVCPAVHQPTPFGLSGQQVLGLISGVWSPKLAGVSVSEFDPGRDARDASLNLLGWLLEWLLLRQSGG